jgi:hypothetical protein
LKESDNHQTVDTLAKKFYILSDDDSLCRLKRALMVYFFFEQNIQLHNPEKPNLHFSLTDKRYDNLIAIIAGKGGNGIELKGHIKFITWNYDLQIDLALRNYFNSKFNTINKIKNELNIHPNQNSYDLPNGELITRNKFAAFKLNGNAFLDNSFYNSGHGGGVTINDYRFNQSSIEIDILTAFLKEYSALFKNNRINSGHAVYKYFNFAWEKEDKYLGHNNVIEEAIKIMQATNVLIIVGYSFPYFNSVIDKKLFAQCLPNEIIIQDLEPEHIKERLSMLLGSNGNSLDGIKVKLQKPDKYFPIHPET